jgi:osmotically-inducible protein OsmY
MASKASVFLSQMNTRALRKWAISSVAIAVLSLRVASVYAQVQPPTTSTDNYRSSEEDQVHTSAVHKYQSEADRANDALLITEVKHALAQDGVTASRAVVVDCDHGTILLSGVVGSAEDADHAAAVARAVNGVLAVKTDLKWQ